MTTGMFLIYKHTSPSGKAYIGQTKNLKKRTRAHQLDSSNCPVFHAAIQKYGWKNFKTQILAQSLTLEQANQLEERYIAEHNTLAPDGYNLISGGLNHTPSAETKLKISKARLGQHPSDETRAKQSAARKGILRTDDAKVKIGIANRARCFGKHLSNETRAKISKAHTGKRHTDETRAKMSVAHTGKPYLSYIRNGRLHTKEKI